MLDAGKLVPAKEHQADKCRFEEERHQSLDGQWRAEDVADVVGVVRPIGSELELHRQSGRDAQHEIDAEDHAPEAGDIPPDLALGHHIDALHDDKEEGEPQRQGHEEKMVHRRQRKLEPRQFDNAEIHRILLFPRRHLRAF